MWYEKLKEANVSIHVVATGGGASFQNKLWEVPGSSAYLSGASFPYAVEEQEELLGFKPEHFCSEEAAVDLASAAYMKAFRFGGKNPVGLGLTASVASEKEHRGDHRVYACAITNDKVVTFYDLLPKGHGAHRRYLDNATCGNVLYFMMLDVLNISDNDFVYSEPYLKEYKEASSLAKERFFLRPFFTANGKRLDNLPKEGRFAIMPGAFNPPHEGHFGAAQASMTDYNYKTVFEITTDPPHKVELTIQALLQRAKLLQGYDRIFTNKLPFYLDKAKKYPGKPLILGADAMVRMLDPKWGLNIGEMFSEFYELGTKLFVAGREIDGTFTTCEDILKDIKSKFPFKDWASAQIIMKPLEGEWDISSTELRNK